MMHLNTHELIGERRQQGFRAIQLNGHPARTDDAARERDNRTSVIVRAATGYISRTAFNVAIVLLVLAAALRVNAAADAVVNENWYIVELDGARIGWMHERIERHDHDAGPRYHSRNDMLMQVGRGGDAAAMRTSSVFVETAEGRPIRVEHEQHMSRQAVVNQFEFTEDGVTLTAKQGDRETVRTMPLPEGTWLTPVAARRFFDERRESGARDITYRTFSPEHGVEPIHIRHRYVDKATFERGNRTLPVTVWTTRTSILPLDMTEHYTADGQLVYQRVQTGIGTLTMRLATREQAQAAFDGPAPEMLVQSFARPDRDINRVNRATTARYRLRLREGEMPDIPSAGAQRVTIPDDNATGRELIIEIDTRTPQPATDADRNNPAYRESSAMVDATDQVIVKLAEQAVRRARSDRAADRADAMRRFVYNYVNGKSLDTAFGTASETARTRAGDCTEHAVLLCAMLRADGIPARTASGLVYADRFAGERDIFGWHMWTQALIDGTWIDFDPTMPGSFHAGHILTGTSALIDGGGADDGAEMTSLILLMGNLDIIVEDVGYDR